ncbi:MAG: ATP-binding protein [Crenarchaeota archaeon]|nr:ATP-binding protein [Thermoproteota archaeon]
MDTLQRLIREAENAEIEGDIDRARALYKRAIELCRFYMENSDDDRDRECYKAILKMLKNKLETISIEEREDQHYEKKIDTVDDYVKKAASFIARSNITWRDIIGLEDVKNMIVSSIYFNLARPEKPVKIATPRRFLLYGPPGTGKTLIAMALASFLKATFINVPIPGILSKYVGESPKILSAIFRLARERAPSVIFFDEIDAIAQSRDIDDHPVTGLLQTLLTELDGFESKQDRGLIIVIAATNKPWLLDEAVLSRFEIKLYIPPPSRDVRIRMMKHFIEDSGFEIGPDISYEELADRTERYTGRDIEALCRKAIQNMLMRANPEVKNIDKIDLEDIRKRTYKIDKIRREDFEKALEIVKPSISEEELKLYEYWEKEPEKVRKLVRYLR